MSAKLILYNADLSPVVRVVKIVAKILGLELELKNVVFASGEHLKEPFIKLNPEHTVPTLVDGDFVLWDSHAICTYLIDNYGKDDKLYPKDLKLRAKCNQRLFFDAGTLFPRLHDCSYHIFYNKGTEIGKDKTDPMHTAFDILEKLLVNDLYLVGNDYSLADISVAGTVLCLDMYAPIRADKYPKLFAYLDRVKQNISYFDDFNTKSIEMYRKFVEEYMAKNKAE